MNHKENPHLRAALAYKLDGYFSPTAHEMISRDEETALERAKSEMRGWLKNELAILETMTLEELALWRKRSFNPARQAKTYTPNRFSNSAMRGNHAHRQTTHASQPVQAERAANRLRVDL